MAEKGAQSKNNEQASPIEINQQFLRGNQAESLGITTERPKFPQYAVAVKRKESYKKWPAACPNLVDELVDAGLVYTGVGDSVRCFYCSGGMRNWENGDDPWVEHAKWYPKCPHVILVKGQSFIDRVSKKDTQGPLTDPPPDLKGREIAQREETDITDAKLLETAAAQSCLQNGYSEPEILQAIKYYMRRNNECTDFKAVDILEIILNDDSQDEKTEDQSETVIYSRSDTQGDANEEQVDALLEENQRLRDSQKCKLCIDDIANVIFLPCGHMVTCPRCSSTVTNCPVCREKIEGTVKAFFE